MPQLLLSSKVLLLWLVATTSLELRSSPSPSSSSSASVSGQSTAASLRFQCPTTCSVDKTRCECPGDVTFSEIVHSDLDPPRRELIVKRRRSLADVSELRSLGVNIGGAYHSLLLKCNYNGSFSDILLALGVTKLTSLTLESYMYQTSLDGFQTLPFLLQELVIQQRIQQLPSAGIPGESGGFGQLRKITISHTKIRSVPSSFFLGVRPSLKSVVITHNNQLVDFPSEALDGLTQLEELKLASNEGLPPLTKRHLASLENLSVIEFNDDGHQLLPHDLFDVNVRLRSIKISSEECRPYSCTRQFNSSFFQNLDDLSSFTYSAGHYVNASFDANTFSRNWKLQNLDIEYSTLLPDHDLKIAVPLAKLRILRVVMCELQSLDPSHILEGKPDLQSVYLGDHDRDTYNHFFCDNCPTVNALVQLKEKGILQGNVLLDCKHNKLVEPEEANATFCSEDGFTIAIVSFLTVFSIIFLAILVFMLVRRQRRGDPVPAVDLQGCEYHAFISYAAEDSDCAVRIIRVLEEEHPYRCFEHTRDFEPGESVVDNISRAVAVSRMTVMVVSRHFLNSDWCDSEMAQSHSAGRRVLVVMRSGGSDMRVEKSDLAGHLTIARHVESHTYLEEDDADFERKLVDTVAAIARQGSEENGSGEGEADGPSVCFKWTRVGLGKWREEVELAQRDPEEGNGDVS